MDLHVHSSQLQQQHTRHHNRRLHKYWIQRRRIDAVTTSTSLRQQTAQKRMRQIQPPSFLSPENVASVPPPGLSAPSQPIFLTIPGCRSTSSNGHEGDDDNGDVVERIILSYVAVQPKASYPSSTHSNKSRVSAGGGIRSLYRPFGPLTTSTTAGNNNSSSGGSITYQLHKFTTSKFIVISIIQSPIRHRLQFQLLQRNAY